METLIEKNKAAPANWPKPIDGCDSSNPCNKITNGGLDSAAYPINNNGGYRPISGGHVYCWQSSNGNPFTSASDRNNIPTTIDWSQYNHDLVMDALPDGTGDGVFQSNMGIVAGRLYFIRFQISVSNAAFSPFFPYLGFATAHVPANADNFYVKFANGLGNSNNPGHTAPPNPQSQLIEQLTNVQASDPPQWQEVTVCVRANSNYSSLWFYPKQNSGSEATRVRIRNIVMREASAGVDVVTGCGGGSSVHLGQGCATIPGATYSWSPTTGLNNPNVLNPNLNTSSLANLQNGVQYTLTVNWNGCSVSDSVTITSNSPVLNMPEAIAICKDDLPIILNANPTGNVISYTWYLWNPNTLQFELYAGPLPAPGGQTLQIGAPGYYAVVADAGNNCVTVAYVGVYIQALPSNLNTDFALWAVAPSGQPTFQMYTNPAINPSQQGLFHAYYISEVNANFQNPQFVGVAWGNNGLQLLQYQDLQGNTINTFNTETHYEIKHGIWNECGDWTETRRYIYVD